MREMQEPLAYFQLYAERKLQDHIDKLEHQYERRDINLVQKGIAYKRQQKIFEKELSKKIDQLAPADFDYIRHSLWNMKDFYAQRLPRV